MITYLLVSGLWRCPCATGSTSWTTGRVGQPNRTDLRRCRSGPRPSTAFRNSTSRSATPSRYRYCGTPYPFCAPIFPILPAWRPLLFGSRPLYVCTPATAQNRNNFIVLRSGEVEKKKQVFYQLSEYFFGFKHVSNERFKQTKSYSFTRH